jgi:hypothetical protein
MTVAMHQNRQSTVQTRHGGHCQVAFAARVHELGVEPRAA